MCRGKVTDNLEHGVGPSRPFLELRKIAAKSLIRVVGSRVWGRSTGSRRRVFTLERYSDDDGRLPAALALNYAPTLRRRSPSGFAGEVFSEFFLTRLVGKNS